MTEALLAYAHFVAILSVVVFITSEAALCRAEWLNAAVVRRLAREWQGTGEVCLTARDEARGRAAVMAKTTMPMILCRVFMIRNSRPCAGLQSRCC